MEEEKSDSQRECEEHAREERKTTGQGNGMGMDFAVAGIIDKSQATSPTSPEWDRQGRGSKRAEKGEQVNVEWEGHWSGGGLEMCEDGCRSW